MKTEKISFIKAQNALSRAEMKKIMAGSGEEGGACVHCETSMGSSCWWRNDPTDHAAICREIYPTAIINYSVLSACIGCTMN